MSRKAKQALKYATEAAEAAASWIELHNVLFGIGGKLGELFPTESERTAFSRSDEYARILGLIDELRERVGDPAPLADLLASANGAISVRLPKSIHAALLAESKAEGVSLNQLVVTKLCVQLRAAV